MRQHLLYPPPDFQDAYAAKATAGLRVTQSSHVAIVGLARDCAQQLLGNLRQMIPFVSCCRRWSLHIESNDCTDNTPQVLADFCAEYRQATFCYRQLGRESYGAEFAGRRTVAMSEYRTACQKWVGDAVPDADYVVVIDFDQWGGWSNDGLLNGFGWLHEMPEAFGMASVSLFQHDFGNGPHWAHYDLWALRGVGQANCYWDTYQNGYGGFGYNWLPVVGSPPALVSSAFGGLAIYRASAYLAGKYDGTDCEHVPFHRSITAATGQRLYLNPSQRCVMNWLPESSDGGQHSQD